MKKDRDVVLFRVDRKIGLLMLGVLAVVLGGFALAEQLTLTTSYPVPSGIYNQLITTGDSGAVPADTTLNRSAGNTYLAPYGGRVGIASAAAPAASLDVNGAVRIGNLAAAPAAGTGSMYYDTARHTFFGKYDAGAPTPGWAPIGGAAACITAVKSDAGTVMCPAGTHAVSGACYNDSTCSHGTNDNMYSSSLFPVPTNGASLASYTGFTCWWWYGGACVQTIAICCP